MSALSLTTARRQLAWLESRGISLANVALSHAESIGAGLTAKTRMPAGAVLLSIPPGVWKPFSAMAAARDQPFAERVSQHAEKLGAGKPFTDAALLAAKLALMADGGGGDDPAIAPFISTLPQPDVPLLWPAQLRAALLRGTSAGPAAESQVALSDSVHAAIVEAVSSSGSSSDAAPTQAAFRWAQAVLLSRAHSGEGKPLALVPGLDLLNHSASAGGHVRYHEDAFELVATRDHAEGEAIEIDYGLSASHRLLRLYGFLPGGGGGGGGGDRPAMASGEEVVVPLLPTPAELHGAPAPVLEEVAAIRAALQACGIAGSSLRLYVEAGGAAVGGLPTLGEGKEAATALRVLLSAVDSQRRRQQQGGAACAAVKAAPGKSATDEAARRRAAMCEQLHAREAAVLEAAWAQLQAELPAL